MAYSTAWWSPSRFMTFLASVSIVRLIKSLWVDHSKIWHNSSCPYSIFTACKVKVHAKISIVEIFVVFIFACRTRMRKFPAIRYLKLGGGGCSPLSPPPVSAPEYSCIRSTCHDQVQISLLYGLNLLGMQCTYKCGSVVILIVPALVLFLPSNCTRMLAHPEINSTRGKNSRKYSTRLYDESQMSLGFLCWFLMYVLCENALFESSSLS